MIGIDSNTWLVYEGVGNYGHGIWPTPVISIATLIFDDDDWETLPSSQVVEQAKLVFREDSFDPVTRVRRGRLYEWRDRVLPQQWVFLPHPAEPADRARMTADGRLKRMLNTYEPVRNRFDSRNAGRVKVVLGTRAAPTVWSVVCVETIASGEELITLRARSTFGALPELLVNEIPEISRAEVLGALDHVADAAFRSSPVSLIDLCRAAATVIFAQWLKVSPGSPEYVEHLDLGDLLKLYEKQSDSVNTTSALSSAVRLFQRFHSRGKPNEQKKYNTRKPTEEDAQLVLLALGFVLRELGWAK